MKSLYPRLLLLAVCTALLQASPGTAQPDCFDYADHPSLNSELTLPGFCKAMASSGDYLYVTASIEGVQVVDISDPTLPHKVGSFPSSGQGFDVALSENLLFFADGFAGLHILSLENPASPAEVGAISPGGKVRAVEVVGNLAFLAIVDGTSSLSIIDVTDPAQPSLHGQILVGNNARDVEVQGSWAYLLDEEGSLAVIDISDPTLPLLTDTIPVADTAFAMDRYGSLLAVAAYLEGVVILDLTNPASPQQEGTLVPQTRTSSSVTEVFLDASRGYCITSADEVVVFTTDDPLHPRQLTSLPLVEDGYGVLAHNDLVLATLGQNGLQIIEDNGFDLPLPVGALPAYQRFAPGPLALEDGYAFVASDRLAVVRLFFPNHPTLVASVPAGDTNTDLALSGNHGYIISDPFNRILVYDLSNPVFPQQVETINTAGNHPDLVLAHNGYLYSGPHSSDLGIFDLALPAAPELLGYENAGLSFHAMAARGDSLFLARTGQVGIFDISDPVSPVEVGTIATEGTLEGLALEGSRLFMVSRIHGLFIADLNQPGHPVVGHYPAAHAVHVTVHQGVAYLSDTRSGLHVLDLADITAPRLLGIKRGGCVATAIEGDHLIASGSGYLGGVEILPLQCNELSPVTDQQTPARTPELTAYPNPFNPSTTVSFRSQGEAPVTLTIHDALGKKVRRLVSEHWYAAGRHEVIWDGRDSLGRLAASGVYFVHMHSGPQKSVLPVTLLK